MNNWWTWTVRTHTIAKVPIQVNLLDSFREPIYLKLAKETLRFLERGFSYCKIAKLLNVEKKLLRRLSNGSLNDLMSFRWIPENSSTVSALC